LVLTANIDLGGKPWMAIGGTTDDTNYYFKGQFDGRGHVIRNLNVKDMNTGRVGLFGMANNATIENVGIDSGTVIGYTQAGGICGYSNSTTIRSCYNKALIYGNSKSAGIAGGLSGTGEITDCYNVGLVLAEGTDKNTGGIFGNAADSTKYQLRNCYNVNTHNGIGGNVNAPVTDSAMTNCYSTGSANLLRKVYAFGIVNSAIVSADTLRGSATVLGENYCADTANINHGYPVLTWEMGTMEEALFFDFSDSEADRARYFSGVYGWRNFDDPTQWFRSDVKIASVQTLTDKGELCITAQSTIDDSVWPDLYIDTAIDGANKTFPLNYSPDQAEFFQIRFRMKDLRMGNYIKEGETKESTVSPYLRLSGYGRDMTSISATASYTYLGSYPDSGEYLTVTLPVSEEFRQAEIIGRIRIYLGGVESIPGTQGSFTIDYIYLGPEDGLPTKTYKIDFVNHDGTVLQSSYVPAGEPAVYYGSTPKKTKDETAHYSFTDWDKSLETVSADTVFTARFSATPHSFTYKTVDELNHKATCSCGYNKTEIHAFAYKASKNPTTSSTGTLTGTCSACSGTTTVTLPKLNTTDYKKTTAKAPTCTETGTDKYTWKTTTYGSFYFTVTTAAKGHTEVIDKAVAPTCTATGLTEGKHCSVCNAVLTAQTAVAATGHSYTYKATKNPTTSATGTLTGTCSACSGTTTVNLPKLNTTDYTKTTTKAPTCTATGTDKYTWKTTTYGSFYFTVTTAAKGHAEVIDKAVAPTCTATGLTEGKHCSVCNAILTAQKTVAAMGHSYDEGTLTKAPTLTEEGCLIFTCKNDPAHFYVQSVERLAESLLFHFDNSPAAMERYENYIYGGRNFDQGSQWFHSASKVLHAQTDESTGELVVTAASTADDSLWPDVYIDTAIDGLNKTFPLNYSPANAEYFQIRFRLKNLRFGTYVKEGETKESVVSPYLRLSGYGRQMTSISGTENYTYLKPYIDADEYLTVTLPIGEEFRQAEVIGRIRVYLGGVESVEGTEGTFVIDYIYIGPEKDLPTKAYEVRFLNHDGTLLQSNLVAKGSLAVYYGSTPKKTKDAQAHYTFAGWDGNLDNISADADFTALFTPTAHAYTYSAVTEESHKASCSCGYSKTEVHSYFQGFCPCGAEERKEPLEDPNLNLSHSLNLASDISVNYVILKNKLTGFDMSTVYVESVLDVYEGNEKVGTKTIRLEPVDTGYYYYFTLEGLTAVQMSNRIHSVLHGMKDGQAYFSPMDDYSIADYAYSQLNKTNTTNKLRVLCADLLRYGAKAQIYKNYRTDSLADASMTEEHKLYLSSLDAVTFGSVNADLKDLPGAPIAWAGKSLNLESKVCLKFVFNTSAYTGALENLSLRISYEDRTGATKTLILTNPESYSGSSVLYAFTVESLLAAELRTVVSVQIYSGDSPVSSTLQYSPDTYGNNKTGSLLELCKALFAYSDSAKGYFVG
ncbi:MAG: hypothetical protein IKT58_07230, partial [Oscillospiraceae bacterium]|nr:hypothetical protein [Oscillospiraceae bacterium]